MSIFHTMYQLFYSEKSLRKPIYKVQSFVLHIGYIRSLSTEIEFAHETKAQ